MKAFRILLVAPLLLLLFYWYVNQLQAKNDNDETRNIVKKTLTFGKVSRDCYISSSANRLKDKKAPIVIFLHGMDGAWPGRKFTKPQYDFINKMAWKYNFIAVFPQGTMGSCTTKANDPKGEFIFYTCWNSKDNKDRDFINNLKSALVNQYGADSQKAYLIGFSNGGYFVSNYMIKSKQNDFAGYGIHSAGGEIEKNDNINKNLDKFLISLNVGNKDEYQLNDMRKLKDELVKNGWQLNKNLNYEEYYARHEMSRTAFENEIKFFLKKD